MEPFPTDGTSLLAENMSAEASEMVEFPLLIGDEIGYFHSVTGGYNNRNDCHVVNFVHEVQGVGRPNHIDPDQASHNFEAHLSDNYYNMDVTSIKATMEDYPEEDYFVSVRVDSYKKGPQSFSEPMTKNIDKRERREEL
jgi:hypothetical protein